MTDTPTRAATVLDIDDLSVLIHGRHGDVQALSNASLSIAAGEVVALVGESGGGKSMLANAIIRSFPRHTDVSGSIALNGDDVMAMSDDQLLRHRGGGAALCFQSPRLALAPMRTVGHQVVDRLRAHQNLPKAVAREHAVDLFRRVGLRNPEQRFDAYPHELSGGMCQRVMIAAALACEPDILIADEPTTGLDVTLTRDILALFRDIADTGDRGVLLVSHDLASVAEASDRIVVLYAGSVVEAGPTSEVLDRPRHPYTRTLVESIPDLDGRGISVTAGAMPIMASVPTSCPFVPRCSAATEECSTGRPRLDGDPLHRVACFHPLVDNTATAATTTDAHAGVATEGFHADDAQRRVVAIDDLHVVYRGRIGSTGHHALRGVSLDVDAGETVGIVGESGCGKSTLARTVMGLQAATSGSVRVAGHDLGPHGPRDRQAFSSQIQMVFQDPIASLSPRRTIRQSIDEPMIAAGIPSTERDARVERLLSRVGLDPALLNRRPHELSGGQAQRVSIARALSVDPQVVVFDEPTSALDVTVQAQILELIAELAADGDRAYLFISHDLATVRAMCDRVAVLYLGRIVEIGTAEEIFTDARHPYTRALLASTPSIANRTLDTSAALQRDLDEATEGSGCALRPRCPRAEDRCATAPTLETITPRHAASCWFAGDQPNQGDE